MNNSDTDRDLVTDGFVVRGFCMDAIDAWRSGMRGFGAAGDDAWRSGVRDFPADRFGA